MCLQSIAGELEMSTLLVADKQKIERLKKDAERYRWLLQYLVVAADAPGDWTCWLALKQICFRSKTSDPQELLDALIARFPLVEEQHERQGNDPRTTG
jgi:hypothetical protein